MTKVANIIVVIIVISISLSACGSTDNPLVTVPPTEAYVADFSGYQTVDFNNHNILYHASCSSWIDSEMLQIESMDELEESQINLQLEYDTDFFAANSLLVLQFCHSSSEQIVEVTKLIINDGKICPVITINSTENISTDINYSLILVELPKGELSHPPGQFYVINTCAPSRGSCKYDPFEEA